MIHRETQHAEPKHATVLSSQTLETWRLVGMCPGLARRESVGSVVGLAWNQTDPFVRSKYGPQEGYPDLLLPPVRW